LAAGCFHGPLVDHLLDIEDPSPTRPAPFECADGLPALLRMSRLLYEQHIPADPLLTQRFAVIPPGQPQRLAHYQTWV
jgi:hypothetical protein